MPRDNKAPKRSRLKPEQPVEGGHAQQQNEPATMNDLVIGNAHEQVRDRGGREDEGNANGEGFETERSGAV